MSTVLQTSETPQAETKIATASQGTSKEIDPRATSPASVLDPQTSRAMRAGTASVASTLPITSSQTIQSLNAKITPTVNQTQPTLAASESVGTSSAPVPAAPVPAANRNANRGTNVLSPIIATTNTGNVDSSITNGGTIDGGLVSDSPQGAGGGDPSSISSSLPSIPEGSSSDSQSPISPSTTEVSSSDSQSSSSSGLPISAVLGISVGGIVVLIGGFVATRKLKDPAVFKSQVLEEAPTRTEDIFLSVPRQEMKSTTLKPLQQKSVSPYRQESFISRSSYIRDHYNSLIPEQNSYVISGVLPTIYDTQIQRQSVVSSLFPEDFMSQRSGSPERQQSNLVNAAMRMATRDGTGFRDSTASSEIEERAREELFDMYPEGFGRETMKFTESSYSQE